MDYLLECVSPVLGTSFREPPGDWAWGDGEDLLKKEILDSAVGSLSRGKAPGPDDITPEMMQEDWN